MPTIGRDYELERRQWHVRVVPWRLVLGLVLAAGLLSYALVMW